MVADTDEKTLANLISYKLVDAYDVRMKCVVATQPFYRPSRRSKKNGGRPLTALTDNMTFGTFMAPFHRVGENPTLALERDLELIEWLDALGFDEAWIGEHHNGG